jgi:large subunit ribosomal protein L15
MKFNDLQVKRQKTNHRSGRGISAGQGMTAGRGTKGQNARKSGPRRPGFEGGQTPTSQRMPKLRSVAKGSLARSAKKTKAENIFTSQLISYANKSVDNFVLAQDGLITNPYTRVKLLYKGDLSVKVDVSLQGASANAIAAIQKAGGSFSKVPKVLKLAKK